MTQVETSNSSIQGLKCVKITREENLYAPQEKPCQLKLQKLRHTRSSSSSRKNLAVLVRFALCFSAASLAACSIKAYTNESRSMLQGNMEKLLMSRCGASNFIHVTYWYVVIYTHMQLYKHRFARFGHGILGPASSKYQKPGSLMIFANAMVKV